MAGPIGFSITYILPHFLSIVKHHNSLGCACLP